jgi:translocation and assembly module TamB
MNRWTRLRRVLLGTAAVLAVLCIAVLIAGHFYLRSSRVAQDVQEQLQAALGVPAEVGSAHVGLAGDTVVRDLRLIDEGDHEPFLRVGQAAADLSVLRYLIGGRVPRRIDLRDAHLRLRFDRDGKLLTRLHGVSQPSAIGGGPLPALDLRNASITIEQEGRPDFTLQGISLTLKRSEGENLTGVIDDPAWKPIEMTGHVGSTGDFSITLSSKGLALTHAMLRSLPLVQPALWARIQLDGPSVPLKFTLASSTKAGGDKSASPGVSYKLAFDHLRITLPQTDRPALVASPVHGELEGNENGFRLTGAVRDHYWGNWAVSAGLVAKTGVIKVELHTPDVVVDQKKLEAVPYVPKSVWQQVRANGETAVDVQVNLSTHKPDVHYRVDLKVKQATVYVSSIDLQATSATGEVIVEDNRVLLRNVTGATAGGTIATSGDLDFAVEPNRLKFNVDARGLALKDLPKKWDLPAQLDGKLTGKANLVVTLRDGNPETSGSGAGRIEDVKLVGLPAKPIPLELSTDGKRIRLTPQSPLVHILLYAAAPEVTTVPMMVIKRQGDKETRRQGDLQPGRLVGQAVSGLGTAVNWVAGSTSEVLRRFGEMNRPAKPGGTPLYLNANLSLTDVDLADLLRRLNVMLPFEVAGRLSFNMKVGIPVNTTRDFRAYRLDGSVILSHLSVAGVPMENVRAGVNYQKGVLRLDKLTGNLGKGSFQGNASVQVVPRGNLSVDLAVKDLPTADVLQPIPALSGKASGTVSFTVRAGVPLDRLREVAAWTGTASLSVPVLNVVGLVLRNFSTGLTLVRGAALLSDLRGEVQGGQLSGSGSLSLTGMQRFQSDLKLAGLDVRRLTTLLPASWTSLPNSGAVTASAELRGTLTPLNVTASGKLTSGAIQVVGARFDRLALDWTLDDRVAKVSNLKAALYRGEVTGTATAPLTGRSPGRLDLKINNVDLLALAGSLGGLPFKVEGRVSGTAKGQYVPPKDGAKEKTGAWTAEMDVSASTLKLQNVPVEKLHGKLDYRDGKAEYQLEGNALGGKLRIDGKLPPEPMGAAGRTDGRLRIEGVRMSRLWRALGLRRRLGSMYGVLSVDLPFRIERPSLRPVGQGQFEIRDLAHRGSELTDSLRGNIVLTGEGVFLRNVEAELAGGVLRAGVAYRFRAGSRSAFTLSLSQVESSRLLGDQFKDTLQGPISLELRGSLGREWRGAGSLEMARGKVFGVEVSEWRVPLDFTYAPGAGRGELLVRDSSAQVGQGRARLATTFNWNDHMRLEGSLQMFDAGLRSLAGLLGDVTTYAQGRVTGRFDFGGGEIHSVNDLTGNLQATLREAQALQLPILSPITPFLLPGQGSTTFRSGDVRARLANGVWRISQMTLENNLAKLIIQGTITVQGRLDLNVVGRTNSLGGLDPVLLRILARRLPPFGPVPVGLIFQVTEFLSNRVVHLRITGTTKAPQVQVEALRLLSEEAVRFFLSRTLLP